MRCLPALGDPAQRDEAVVRYLLTAAAIAVLVQGAGGRSRVPMDQAIETMQQTGVDMLTRYKETSLGGLAVNVPER